MGKFNYETKMGTDASQGIIVRRMHNSTQCIWHHIALAVALSLYNLLTMFVIFLLFLFLRFIFAFYQQSVFRIYFTRAVFYFEQQAHQRDKKEAFFFILYSRMSLDG